MKKKALLTSVLTIALCLSLIAGSTFALFTSTSTVNVAVTSGKVNVIASIENLQLYSPTTIAKDGKIGDATNAADNTNFTFKNRGTASLVGNKLTLTNITPGDKVTFDIKITNNSNVTVQYRNIIEKITDDGLWAGLKVSIGGTEYDGATKKSEWAVWTETSNVITVPVVIELPATAGNIYQGKKCELAYTVEAVQGNADMPSEWDGVTKTAPQKDASGVYHLTNAAEVAYAMENSTPIMNGYSGNPYAFGTYVLERSIDFGGATIDGFGKGSSSFKGTFDGQGHTISNFVIDASNESIYGGLFGYLFAATVKNLNVSDAIVIGQSQVGVLVGAASDNSTVSNCKVYNSAVFATETVGAVVGYTMNSGVTNCYAENCNVYYSSRQGGEVVGYAGYGSSNSNNDAANVTVTQGTYVANGVALNNGTYEILNANGMFWLANEANKQGGAYYTFTGKTAKLVADIDLNDQAWTPIGYNYHGGQFAGTFDGNGHTIRNLNVTADVTDDTGYYGTGLFGWNNGTVKNLTIDGAKVSGYGFVGAVAGYMERGSITGCTVKNAEVAAIHKSSNCCGDKAGAVVGYLNPGNCTITNNTAENCAVSAARDAGQIIGCAYTSNTVSGNTATNVTVSANTTDCDDTDAGQNIANDIIGRTISG